jgi:septation ring formation regulator EzrA
LEEHNLAQVDQLHVVEQKISSLHTQLAKVRSGKQQAETERAECGKLQDKMKQELQGKVHELTPSNRELTERLELKEMTALEALADCDKAGLDLNCFKLQQSWKEKTGKLVRLS